MSLNIENESSFREVFDSGLNLFVGAGFSVNAKNKDNQPFMLGGELKNYLIKKFECRQLINKSLSRVCSYIKRNSKGAFINEIKQLFDAGEYDTRYSSLCNLNLKNILTFNVDNLIELIYSSNGSDRFISDVQISGFMENPGINLFKLYGSITYPYDKEMLFSTDELNNQFRIDSALWHAVATKIAAHPTLFWGINVEDINLIETLSPATLRNRPSKPKWIVILPDAQFDVDADEYRALGFRIIRATTDNMLDYLSKIIPKRTLPDKPSEYFSMIFPNEYIDQILKREHPVRPISFFYQGFEPTWGEVLSGKIAKISFYNQAIELIRTQSYIHITGSPGCGRTTLLMQLATSEEMGGYKFFFSEIARNRAEFLKGKFKQSDKITIFIDNMADNFEAYNVFAGVPNIRIVSSEMDISYERIKHLVRNPIHIIDISDLPNADIQTICNSMNRSTQQFPYQKVSLLEIVYKLWSGEELRTKIKNLIISLKTSEDDLLEFYTFMTYVRFCHISATMDMMYAYYSDYLGFEYDYVYKKINRIHSLINEAYDEDESNQDSFSLRSKIFADISLDYIPHDILKKVLVRFHKNIHRGHIKRYDVFKKFAYDADITIKTFELIEEGKAFYEALIEKDSSPYIKHQYSLYLLRKRDKSGAWEQIDDAYTQSGGRIHSISNTHAMILFETNIDKEDDANGLLRETLHKSFDVLENCMQLDLRKYYHITTYARQAVKYSQKYNDELTNSYREKAKEFIKAELAKKQFIPRSIFQSFISLQRELG